MQLKVVSQDGGVLRMDLEGKICQQGIGTGVDPFVAALGEDAYTWKLLLSLERADMIDSLGVAWLLKCHKRFRDEGGQLVLHSIPPAISQVLRVLQLNRVFQLADDAAAAQTLAVGAKT